jgi:hypothetical protein
LSDLIFRHDRARNEVAVFEVTRDGPQEIVRLTHVETGRVYAWLGYVWGGSRGVVPSGAAPDEMIAVDPLAKVKGGLGQ